MTLEELWQLFPIRLTEYQPSWQEFEFNRDGYTNAKTDFVRTYTETAKEIYKTKGK